MGMGREGRGVGMIAMTVMSERVSHENSTIAESVFMSRDEEERLHPSMLKQ